MISAEQLDRWRVAVQGAQDDLTLAAARAVEDKQRDLARDLKLRARELDGVEEELREAYLDAIRHPG